jgi:hypothetical protein
MQVNPRESVVSVSYRVPRWSAAWAVPEVPVPESDTHDLAIEYLRSVLLAWAERERRVVKIARNLGVRWVEEEPRAGFDPDLCVIEPPPADEGLSSLRLWEPTHVAPWLAIEVVSPSHPYKDYIDTPDRCAACGVRELWVYDPMLAGPRRLGGPHALQIWSADESGTLTRIFAGKGPALSPSLGAWLHPGIGKSSRAAQLRISSGRDANGFWPTEREELTRQRDEHAREREELAQRVAELERQLENK